MTGKRAAFFTILIGWQICPPLSDAATRVEAGEVPLRMARADDERRAAMPDYTYMRRYILDNARFHQHAEMVVRVTARHQTGKEVEVVSFTGSDTVRNHVFRKLLEAERSAAREEVAAKARINSDNYDFEFAGMESTGGRNCYVLQMKPKGKSKFLLKGRVWVDAEDFGIVRVEGRPAQKVSMWVGKTHLVEHYRKVGRHWLPVLHESQADSFMWGSSALKIESYDYNIPQPGALSAAARTASAAE